jgi:hypothetical protein
VGESLLLVDLAEIALQVCNQFLDALRDVRVCRNLPGKFAVPQDLHFEFNALVLGHGIPTVFLIRQRNRVFVHLDELESRESTLADGSQHLNERTSLGRSKTGGLQLLAHERAGLCLPSFAQDILPRRPSFCAQPGDLITDRSRELDGDSGIMRF